MPETGKKPYIPNYEKLFFDTETDNSTNKKKTDIKILKMLFKSNISSIIVSSLLYIVKNSPAWIVPIITSNIINEVTYYNESSVRNILINFIILCACIIQNIPTHVLYSKYTDRMLRTIGAGMRNTLVRKLQHLSLTYHKEIESGRIQAKFIRDIEAMEFFNNHFIKSCIPALIGLIVTMTVSGFKSGAVVLFYIFVIPANVFLVNSFRRKMSNNNRHFRKESENMSAKMTTMLEMIPVTKAHGLENEEISALERNIAALKEKGLVMDRTNAYFGSVAWVVSQLLSACCLLFTGSCIYRQNSGRRYSFVSIVFFTDNL